jgi:hypothetical protein
MHHGGLIVAHTPKVQRCALPTSGGVRTELSVCSTRSLSPSTAWIAHQLGSAPGREPDTPATSARAPAIAHPANAFSDVAFVLGRVVSSGRTDGFDEVPRGLCRGAESVLRVREEVTSSCYGVS